MTHWEAQSIPGAIQHLQTDASRGLSGAEVERRTKEHGPNELEEQGLTSPWRILWEQFTAILVVILIIAALVSALLGDYKDATAILTIVLLNALLGFRQEYRAERAMAALRRLAAPTVKVRRDGHVSEVSSRELTVGDIVLLEAGSAVPADGRLLSSNNLRIQEAALTGESEPVEKDAQLVFEEPPPLGDRRNMAYLGTTVTYGRGTLAVTSIGMKTELGKIANMIKSVSRDPTPLQRRLDHLGKVLAALVLTIVGLIFVLGMLQSGLDDMEAIRVLFLTAVSLAVAAVPEGLPAVVTIALALGSQRMLRRKALIRKLPAVETLGSVTAICSDKTGTLTKNQMTVTVLDVAGRSLDVEEDLVNDRAEFIVSPADIDALASHPALSLLLSGAALCNDAVMELEDVKAKSYRTVGDPTEGALVVAAARLGMKKEQLEEALPRIGEVPFDSDRKRMTTLHRCEPNGAPELPGLELLWPKRGGDKAACQIAFAKGAIDSLLRISSHVWNGAAAESLTAQWSERIMASHDRLASDGMRVLGLAFRASEELESELAQNRLEQDMVFVGLLGMIDPPRPEVRDAVETCRTAGIRPLMITGDHPLTATYIAGQLGIDTDSGTLTGAELDESSDQQLEDAVSRVSVFARVSPEHKLKLVHALQRRGQIVAMTGDGVNDAPALKTADIGVAMGIIGTDVAKEAADMVLQDDNFATIVAAVEEGRTIFDNIRKFMKYLLSANSGEIWVMLVGPLLGMPLPLLPLQILWINLVTDGLPALALGVEPAERGIMRRPPFPPGQSIFARGAGVDIVWLGLVMGLVSLAVGYGDWFSGADTTYWRTMVFSTLTFSQMTLALSIRSERESAFRVGWLSNRYLLAAVALTVVLQLGVIYWPFAQQIFATSSLAAQDLAICLGASTIVFWALELKKWIMRRHHPIETSTAAD